MTKESEHGWENVCIVCQKLVSKELIKKFLKDLRPPNTFHELREKWEKRLKND